MLVNVRFFIIIPLFLFTSLSQAGAKNFYGDLAGLDGYKLKSQLKKIIRKSHVSKGYAALINVYFSSDIDTTYDNDGSIVDMYSENPSSYDTYNFANKDQKCGNYNKEADCFNREHIFPQGIFDRKSPMKSDFFHVYPSDGHVNRVRGSFPFGEVKKASWTSTNGSKLGVNSTQGYHGTVFEPIDEFKGDIARALFYFATRYEDRVKSWKHDMIDGSSDQVYSTWFLKILLKWHKADPVSAHELKRNEIGYKYQGNRNPFIDNPELVTKIWGHL